MRERKKERGRKRVDEKETRDFLLWNFNHFSLSFHSPSSHFLLTPYFLSYQLITFHFLERKKGEERERGKRVKRKWQEKKTNDE